MQEFTISKKDEYTSEPGYYMYISFNKKPLDSDMLVTCSGSALIIPDGKTKYWFLYNFLHSKDWRKILKMRIEQRDHKFSATQLKKFGEQIAHLINYFISQSN